MILIQFTGIGCGPCHQSVPFLKQLVEEYKTSDFEFVSIETWSENRDGLKRYYEKNALNYKFLKSEEGVADSYRIYSVPAFFILDEKRLIRKVLTGYGKGETDKAIRNALKEWL